MEISEISALFNRLLEAEVAFLVVGGVAVAAHGHGRVTHDLDLVIGLNPENAEAAIAVFEAIGLSPRIPVALRDFLEPNTRNAWVRERNMQVFSLLSKTGKLVVDVFAELPFSFEDEFSKRSSMKWPDVGRLVPFICKDSLIEMKRQAGRPIDLDDVNRLLES